MPTPQLIIPSPTPALILFGKRLAALYQTLNATTPIAEFASADAVTKVVVLVFRSGVTQLQQDQATSAVSSFDWSQAAQLAWEDAQEPDFTAIRTQATAAIQNNNTYLATADTATNIDVRTQVKALTQQNTQVIKTLGAVITYLLGR